MFENLATSLERSTFGRKGSLLIDSENVASIPDDDTDEPAGTLPNVQQGIRRHFLPIDRGQRTEVPQLRLSSYMSNVRLCVGLSRLSSYTYLVFSVWNSCVGGCIFNERDQRQASWGLFGGRCGRILAVDQHHDPAGIGGSQTVTTWRLSLFAAKDLISRISHWKL